MKLITAIVRPEKVMDVIKALEQEGYFAFSKWAMVLCQDLVQIKMRSSAC